MSIHVFAVSSGIRSAHQRLLGVIHQLADLLERVPRLAEDLDRVSLQHIEHLIPHGGFPRGLVLPTQLALGGQHFRNSQLVADDVILENSVNVPESDSLSAIGQGDSLAMLEPNITNFVLH